MVVCYQSINFVTVTIIKAHTDIFKAAVICSDNKINSDALMYQKNIGTLLWKGGPPPQNDP